MKIWLHVLLQICGFAVSSVTLLTNMVPDKYKPVVVLLVSMAQAFTAWYNHYYTPEGEPIPPKP